LLGLYREQSHHVVEFKQCPLMTDRVNAAFQRVQKSVREHPALVAGIEEIHLSSSESDSALIRTRHGFNAVRTKQVIELFTSLHFEDISIEVPGHRSCRTFTKVMKLDLNGISYGIAPDTFFQSHWMLNRIVVRHVVERLGSLKGKRVVDLYSGAGNFSLPLARTAAEVIAVEEHSAAIANGIRNARLNELENCRFIQSSAERLQVKDKIDVLVVDPPRLGISGAAMNKILTLAPRRIVSLSCNPSTFARDVKKLLEKYSIESIQLVDFFPQTYHIETLAFLKRK
jgi:23S rRNA (uracil1939-C5)-methyltransferase